MLKTRNLVGLSLLLAGCSAGPDGGDGQGSGSTSGVGSGSAPSAGVGSSQGSGSSPSASGGGVGLPGAGGSGVGGSSDPNTCAPGVPGTSQLTRLTNAQYDKTILSLVGVSAIDGAPPSTLLAPDQLGSMNDLLWGAYRSVAERLARQVMADAALKGKFLKCTLAGDGKDCLNQTVVQFGRQAFRRPLSAPEQARFETLVASGASMTENGTADEVAELLLYAFLVSPGFLQREELTETDDGAGHFALSNHEVASRLSYMLTGTMPDEVLSAAADDGALSTPEQVLDQAKRLLTTPGAREAVAAYHRKYLGYAPGTSRWDSPARVGKSPEFSGFSKDLVPAIMAETEKVFDHVTFEKKGSFKDLLLTEVGYVTAGTAPLYGVTGNFTAELTEVPLGPDRPGFLTRLAFLTGFSDFSRSSPILRGAFITKNVLGVAIGAPPDPQAALTPLPTATDLDTNRKQVDAQTADGVCAECHHGYINPPGFVMEAFDTAGNFQATERLTGAAIDTKADVSFEFGGVPTAVQNPKELMALLAASPQANRFYAQALVSSAYERLPNSNDACVVFELGTKLAGGYTIQELLADLTKTETFRTRTLEGN